MPSIESFSLEDAHQFLFPNQEFNQNNLNKRFSDLKAVLKKYLAFKAVLEDKLLIDLSFLKELNDQNLKQGFKTQLKRVRKKLNNSSFKDDSYFLKKLLIEQEDHNFLITHGNKCNGILNYQNTTLALDQFYFYHKFSLLCHEFAKPTLSPHDLKALDKEYKKVTSFISSYCFPQIQIWRTTIDFLKNESGKSKCIQYYQKLKEVIFNRSLNSGIRPKNIFQLWIILQYRARTLFRDKKLQEELFDLFDFQLANGIFLRDYPTYNPFYCYCILNTALFLKKGDWVERYLSQNFSLLINISKSLYDLCKGMLEFEKENYKNVLFYLKDSHFNHSFLEIARRRLILKLCMELYNDQLFDAYENSFRVYLNRNKQSIARDLLLDNLKFLKYSKKIQYNFLINIDEHNKIISQIEGEENIIEREWLIRIVNKLYLKK